MLLNPKDFIFSDLSDANDENSHSGHKLIAKSKKDRSKYIVKYQYYSIPICEFAASVIGRALGINVPKAQLFEPTTDIPFAVGIVYEKLRRISTRDINPPLYSVATRCLLYHKLIENDDTQELFLIKNPDGLCDTVVTLDFSRAFASEFRYEVKLDAASFFPATFLSEALNCFSEKLANVTPESVWYDLNTIHGWSISINSVQNQFYWCANHLFETSNTVFTEMLSDIRTVYSKDWSNHFEQIIGLIKKHMSSYRSAI